MINDHKPVLIVIAGPNGSGKTTITSKILRHEWMEDAVYINPDNVAQQIFGDWNSMDSVLNAAEYCDNLRERCLEERKSVIFETVLSSKGKLDYIVRAANLGYFVRLFFVCTSSPIINASRIAHRVMEGGHDVPISKIVSRYNKSILNCSVIIPIVDRAYIYDNSVDETEARLLFRSTKGTLTKKHIEKIPEWAEVIFNHLA